MQHRFDPKDALPFAQPGTSTLQGDAMYQHKGSINVCHEALLMPTTPYMEESYDAFLHGQKIRDEDFDRDKVVWQSYGIKGAGVRKAPCDAFGHFQFKNLPAAQWHLIISVQWLGRDRIGSNMAKLVETENGKTTSVHLTEKDIPKRL